MLAVSIAIALVCGGGQAPALQDAGGGQAPALQDAGGGRAPALQDAGGGQAPALQDAGGGQAPALQDAGGGRVPALPGGAEAPQPVREAVAAAVALPGARAEVLELTGGLPGGCALGRAESPRPVLASSRVALHLFGRDGAGAACDGWAWARVRVSAPSLVTTRAVAEGAALEGAVAPVEREVVSGRPPLTALPEGAVADRAVAAGTAMDETLLRVGARPGQPVTVVLRAGALVVEQRGQAVACRRGRACALLPTGRRVEGSWHEGRIELGSP